MPRPERPLEQGDTALIRFATDLRNLRERAGGPAYRQLAATAHYSTTTLSDAAGGRRLPTLAVTLAYVSACGGDTGLWEQRWHTLAAELAGRVATADGPRPDSAPPPYVGLAAFERTDADRFFGRDALVEDLIRRIRAQRFVAVFGASGIGKSSVLRAGLLARWPASADPDVETDPVRRCLLFTPRAHPVRGFATAIASLAGRPADEVAATLIDDRDALHRYLAAASGDDARQDLLLVVDQFEEIFTVCQDTTERTGFVAVLARAVRHPDSRIRVVLGVRTDFYSHCAHDPTLAELLRDGQFLVGPMTTEQLHSAIVRPAALAGASVEATLLATAVADCAGQSGVLPLLSHALVETWQRRRGSTLTLSGYQAAGGITHAIAQTAERTYTACVPHQQRLIKALFLRLTVPSETTDVTEDTKRRVCRDDVAGIDPAMTAVLERLAAARLVTLDRDHIEIAHEAVIQHWPRLRGWLAADREALQLHRRLTDAASSWHVSGRHQEDLYRGVRLTNAQNCIRTSGMPLIEQERDFLTASTDAEEQRRLATRRRTRRLRRMVLLQAVLLAITGVLVAVVVGARQTATQQRNLADAQAELARAAGLQSTDPAMAWQLIFAAERLAPSSRGIGPNSLTTPHAQHPGIRDAVNLAAIAPDGLTIATARSDDTTVTVLSLTHMDRLTKVATVETSAPVDSLALGPDGRTLVTIHANPHGNTPTNTQLWGLGTRHQWFLLAQRPSQWFSASFSGDGRLLMGDDQVWDITKPTNPTPMITLPRSYGYPQTGRQGVLSPG